jgi:hypothetical protein
MAFGLLVVGINQRGLDNTASAQTRGATAAPAAPAANASTTQAARPAAAPLTTSFRVDPMWPKPLPNHWIIGSVTGVAVDARDHVWIVQNGANAMTQNTEMGVGTNPPTAERCCSAAPPVLEFDPSGALVANWGGPADGAIWPRCIQGIAVDPKGNVWIGGDSLAQRNNPPRACQFGPGGSQPVNANEVVQSYSVTGPNGARGPAAGGRGGAAGGAGGAGGRGGAAAADRGGNAGAARGAAPPPAAARGGGRGAPEPPGPVDAMVLKFSPAGKPLMQIGAPGKVEGPDSKTSLNRPTAMDFDAAANEVYIADTGNRRIVVFDMETGAYKRHWGAYGNKPDATVDLGPYDPGLQPVPQFRFVSCVHIAKDGMVYVCDKVGDRIQVFKKDGTYVREALISNTTLGGENGGSVWDIAFSKDPQQRYLYVADGYDKKVIVVRRDNLTVTNTFGQGGRLPGEFVGVGSLAVDSKGNLYTGETFEGKRVQKWLVR